MEDILPLALVCSRLREETRDDTVTKLQKQKHAAHTRCYRLSMRIRELELANRLLAAVWVTTKRQNDEIHNQIQGFMQELEERAAEMDRSRISV